MITDPKELLLTVLHAKDATRDRSTQTQVGPSEIGGCRRKVWYRLNAQPHTNDDQSKLAAIMGTAIHSAIEEAIASGRRSAAPFIMEIELREQIAQEIEDQYLPVAYGKYEEGYNDGLHKAVKIVRNPQ